MAVPEKPFGLRLKCLNCKHFFVICHKCYRGHRYCSKRCSRQARRESLRRADERYRATPSGRRMRQLSQDRYRKRQKNKKSPRDNVNDQASRPRSQRLRDHRADLAKPPSRDRCCVCRQRLTRFWIGVWRGRYRRA
jgi:hypothetical protein